MSDSSEVSVLSPKFPLSIHFPLQSSALGFPFSVLNENNNIAESCSQSITQLHISKTGKFVLVALLLFIH